MNPINELRFSLSDRINGSEIGPARVPLALLGQFQLDVSDFLKGSSRDVDLMQVQIAVQEGSLAFIASGLLAAESLWADLERLKHPESLDQVDPKRAAVVERWQAAARQFSYRAYSISDGGVKEFIRVDSQSDFRRAREETWVIVEKYLYGRVVDWGGKTKANVHLELESGVTLTIAAAHDILRKEDRNRLYRPALLHVTAEENLRSGELRNLRLIAFEQYEPTYDESEFKRMVERGTQAWAEVQDASAWIEELRGGTN